MGYCGPSAHQRGHGRICGVDARTGDAGEFGKFGESEPATETSRKSDGADVSTAKRSSERFTSAPEQWPSEERRGETFQGAAIATGGRFSRVGQWLLLAFVQLYRIFLSPFLGGACKFYPSCSQYAQEAIALHGAKRGSWLALRRLGRCRPLTTGGFDPVPDSRLGYLDSGARRAHTDPDGGGRLAACRERPDYSDAEWLRTANKELAQ